VRPITKSLEDRFWGNVDIRGEDECWPWKKQCNKKGYGNFYLNSHDGGRRNARSNRVAYELTYGPLPEGLCACHTCDNPPCCNPKHLFAGTHLDNVIDKMLKGRASHLVGEQNARCKLTWAQVGRIREICKNSDLSYKAIGELFFVNGQTISDIAHNRTWRTVAPWLNSNQEEIRYEIHEL
jgi:hypothetical protein